MERGVLMGGLLISASFLLAVALNQAAKDSHSEEAPAPTLPVVKAATPPAPCPTRAATDDAARDVHTSDNCEPEPLRRE